MDNNFTPIPPENDFVATAASEEAEVYTPPVIAKETEPELKPEPEKKTFDYAKIFSQPLYLAICILVTVIAAIQFISGGFELLTLLFMIAGWVTYGKAKKNESPLSGMKFTKGVLTAKYVLNYIGGGLLILAGLGLVAFHFTTGLTFKELFDEAFGNLERYGLSEIPVIGENASYYISYIYSAYQDVVDSFAMAGISESVLHSIVFISIGMCITITGALVLLFNVLYTRKLCVFSGSLCENAADPNADILKAKAAKNWLMVIGILTAIGCVARIWTVSFFMIGITAATLICGSVFIKNNFVEK